MGNWRLNALYDTQGKELYDKNYDRIFNKTNKMENLVEQISIKLREQGNKNVKMIFWNENPGNLSIIRKDGTGYNLPAEGTLDADLTVDDICELINKEDEQAETEQQGDSFTESE